MTIRLISFVLSFALGAAAAAQAQDYSAGKTPAQLFASDCSGCHKSPQGLAKGYDVRSLSSFLREHYTSKKESAGALANFVAAAGGGAPAADKPARGSRTAAPEPKPAEPKAAEESNAVRPSSGFPRIFPWQSAPEPKPEAKPEAVEAPAAPAKPTTGRRRTATPSDAKEAEPSTPAIIRHQGGSRPAVRRSPPAEAATAVPHGKPADAKPQDAKPQDAKPVETPAAETKPVETRPAAVKPAEAPRPAAAAPADVPADKLKSYLESGHAAKPVGSADKPAGDKPADAAGSRLNSYATSGDTAASKAAVSGAADKPESGTVPSERPAADKGGEAKPSASEPRTEPPTVQ
ncbi:hypothetical protein RA307_12520 [Xanthobacteraceae bacterium Astr-EGSB]|uniref:hypothetical protein n=1 Tax=Astrobacterium formosum TaxID=3069710 RepID=UPI0027B0340B|nr:hypothetical protein [Xanthobacteraceae bacterium Astr-EGSB]